MRKIRLLIVATIAICALRMDGGEMTDVVRKTIEPSLPAKLQTFTCPEKDEETKGQFYCVGALADGRWLDVLVKRTSGETIEIVKKVAYPAASEGLASVARNGVTADFASVKCPPEAGVSTPDFECSASLVDGSRLTIPASRYVEGRFALDTFQWSPDSPSPLIRAIRSAAPSGAIESITCPYDLAGKFDCTVHFADGRTNAFTIQHSGQNFAVIADLEKQHRLWHRLGMIAIAAGALMLIGGAIWLITLNVRSVIARLAFASPQPVDLPVPGAYVLHLEFPAFTFIPFWRRLQYSMTDALGRDVPLYFDPFPTRVSFVRVRRSVRLFSVKEPGKYQLRTDGVPADRDVSQWGLIVSRSFIGRGVFCIFLIVAGVVAIGAGAIFVNS